MHRPLLKIQGRLLLPLHHITYVSHYDAIWLLGYWWLLLICLPQWAPHKLQTLCGYQSQQISQIKFAIWVRWPYGFSSNLRNNDNNLSYWMQDCFMTDMSRICVDPCRTISINNQANLYFWELGFNYRMLSKHWFFYMFLFIIVI